MDYLAWQTLPSQSLVPSIEILPFVGVQLQMC